MYPLQQRARCRARGSRVVAWCLAALATTWLTVACASSTVGARTVDDCGDSAAPPRVRLETGLGAIEIELYPDAAPGAVARLLTLALEQGYYDGLVLDYTVPHVEIRTAERLPADIDFPTEIDAHALGLHETGPSDRSAAMAIVQNELLRPLRQDKRGAALSPRLQTWLEAWYADRDPGFLVGMSRQQINEALGYRYVEGLGSRPVTRGSVALVPRSETLATPRLSIALSDLPQRTGQWMVVGRVVGGLDLAERIAIAPLAGPRGVKPRDYVPADPIVIKSVLPTCR